MLSRQTWSVSSVPRSRWCRRIVSSDELDPGWLVSQRLWCMTWSGQYAPYTSSALICTASDSELATSVGQSVPDWHDHMATGPERVVQQNSGLTVVGRRLTTDSMHQIVPCRSVKLLPYQEVIFYTLVFFNNYITHTHTHTCKCQIKFNYFQFTP